jgi:uncharacterized repeat protein (TIGR01451 family)
MILALRRRPHGAAPSLALAAAILVPLAAMAACGGSNADLTVKVVPVAAGQQARPGDDVDYVVTVVNNGPGVATGVTVRVDLPTAFRYQSTPSIDAADTTTRTVPSDPVVNTADPQWGEWSMGAPGVKPDGTPAHSTLSITFSVRAEGKPGDYSITPHVFVEGGDETVGKDLSLHLFPASDLSLSIAVDELTAKRGDLVHYHVTVINRGSGPAKSVGILVTLPGAIVFEKTEHVEGNFTRTDPIDPTRGALLVYYGGYNLPAASDAQPGSLAIIFSARVLPTALAGRDSVTAQLTDADGAVVDVGDTATVVIAAPSPTPAPSPLPRGSATPRPSATQPAPTPTPKKH